MQLWQAGRLRKLFHKNMRRTLYRHCSLTQDYYLYLERIFRRFKCTMVLKTNVGLKPVNKVIKSDYLNEIVLSSTTDLRGDQIVAGGLDFLTDPLTLLGKSVHEMPHYELIKYLDKGLSLSDCDYVKRSETGTLDFRRTRAINEGRLKARFKEKLKAMDRNEVFVIRPWLIDENSYMIGDGKHSFAMATYFNYKNLRFEIIPNLFFDTYYRWVYDKISNNQEYKKHHNYFEKARDFRKKEIDRMIDSGAKACPEDKGSGVFGQASLKRIPNE